MDNQAKTQNILLLCQPCEGEESGIPNRIHELKQTIQSLGMKCSIHPASSTEEVTRQMEEAPPDLVWSSVYHLIDQAGMTHNCHQILEDAGIPYVGSSPKVLDLVLIKSELKECWSSAGVRTPEWQVIQQETDLQHIQGWPYFPAIIKPNGEGNSRGLSQDSIVDSAAIAIQYLRKGLTRFGSEMVEHYLGDDPSLHEYTVAMLGNKPNRLLLPAEIILEPCDGKRVITTADKDQHRTRAIPVTDSEMRRKVIDFAESAMDAAGVEDYARLDIMWSEGDLYALEINGQPMLPDRWFDTCCEAGGMDRPAYVSHILNAAAQRWLLRSHQGTTRAINV